MIRPQQINEDGSPKYDSSHLIRTDASRLPFDVGVITAFRDGNIISNGTVFFISQEFAVTAWHVIEDLINNLEPGGIQLFNERVIRDSDMKGRIGLQLEVHIMGAPDQISRCVLVDYVTRSPLADIALLHLSRTEEDSLGTVRLPILHAAPPPTGTTIDAYGAIPQQLQSIYDEGIKTKIEIKFLWSHGIITQHLMTGRGNSLPFPVIETNASFPGGMSGGPVVSEVGIVFGLVCYDAGPNLDNPAGDPLSYVCSLLPVVCCKCEYDFSDGMGKVDTTVKDLADRGIVQLAGIERVRLITDEAGDVTGLIVDPI